MNLLAKYNQSVGQNLIDDDPLQRMILSKMQRLTDELQKKSHWFSRFSNSDIKGFYLYGTVGAGKTFLVDMFFENLKEEKKGRFHFHHFMQQIDAQLRLLQGKKDPLRIIAKDIAKSYRILCFDEFLVQDVAYAMILAELLKALFAEKLVLVISSNTLPDDLYANGVQRQRFLPAIAEIKFHCEILYLNEARDYRVGRQPLLNAYISPENKKNKQIMFEQFIQQSPNPIKNGSISVQNREIHFLMRQDKAIWFNFSTLCNSPRSQLDYLELAERFDTLYLSGVPALTESHTLQALLFIYLIDVLYDRHVKLVIGAEVSVASLYPKGELIEAFKRTYSRLEEMQSKDYLARHVKRTVKAIL